MIALALPTGAAQAQSRDGAGEATEAAPRNAVAAEIRTLVSGRLTNFYRPRGYWPLWVEGDKLGPQAKAFLTLARSAGADGLDAKDYDPEELAKAIDAAKDGLPTALATAELALSRSFGRYLRDMRDPKKGDRAEITYLDKELEPERQREDEMLRIAALAPDFDDYVETMGWMSPRYRELRVALLRWRERWGDLPAGTIPAEGLLRQGSKGEAVAALRRRLGLPAGAVFDKGVAARLRAFQADHGIPADGIAGAQTIAALDRDPEQAERLLRLNLARARLLPGPHVRHVEVNAADARLWYFGEGKQQGTMRVVVGAVETQTPMMAGMVRYATLNPYWNVPMHLVQQRIAPRVIDGATLAAMRYEALSDWSATPRPLEQSEIDWASVAAGRSEVRLRQLPGGNNAMGRVKFMFPNDLGIYLHDTPDKALFKKSARQFSNGCVRLEDAPRLGAWFFDKPLKPDGKEPEQHSPLPQPVPVYLTYLTVVPEKDGVRFLPDVYGRDEKALEKLR